MAIFIKLPITSHISHLTRPWKKVRISPSIQVVSLNCVLSQWLRKCKISKFLSACSRPSFITDLESHELQVQKVQTEFRYYGRGRGKSEFGNWPFTVSEEEQLTTLAALNLEFCPELLLCYKTYINDVEYNIKQHMDMSKFI